MRVGLFSREDAVKPYRQAAMFALVIALVFAMGCSSLVERGTKEAIERGTGVKVDEKNKKVTIKTDKGTIEAESGEGKLPADFPKQFPVYEGATVKSGAKARSQEGTMFTALWEVSGAAEPVVEFYKKKLPESGYKVTNTVETPESTGFVLKEDGVVTIKPEGGKVVISAVLNVK